MFTPTTQQADFLLLLETEFEKDPNPDTAYNFYWTWYRFVNGNGHGCGWPECSETDTKGLCNKHRQLIYPGKYDEIDKNGFWTPECYTLNKNRARNLEQRLLGLK